MKNLIIVVLIFLFVGFGAINAQETTKKEKKMDQTTKMNEKEMMDMDRDTMNHKKRNHDIMDHEKMDHMDMKKDDNQRMGNVNNIIKDWPEHTKKSAEETIKAYGVPNGITDKELIWYNAGVWELIRLSKDETDHDFPVAHTDYIQMTIYHDVPEEKMSALGEFDGSVTFDRTQGHFSARCDLEANNFLALNLAHDIINDKKTVEEARKAYADIIKEKMSGASPAYMEKLQFTVETKAAADADVNTTGLTKEEVMAAIKKNTKM
ncbi:hypothetical protein SAMN03097699_0489 [Flavobacteriaceae bacterium MAR_2010_188]|nr:hypothetical protein SAMN03097699_0489 [Flavobacteriaceae bacterium MAR_2010_188]